MNIIREDPFQNPPRYEALVGNLSGLFSRRVNIQHRIVYQVYQQHITEDGVEFDGIVKIIRMWTRYEKI